jgi:hypothetical protein
LKKAALAAFWGGRRGRNEFEDSEGLEGTERSESDLESAIAMVPTECLSQRWEVWRTELKD